VKLGVPNYLHPASTYTARTRTDNIVIHCSADDKEDGIMDTAEDIREMHVLENGWLDIGYHFVIERDGMVQFGRPAWSVGAGVVGHNHNSLHICLVGGADAMGRGENDFTDSQWEALTELVTVAWGAYGRPKVLGHRDFGVPKDCPSFDVRTWWYPIEAKLAKGRGE